MMELVRAFLKMGALGFGGPIAALAMMEDEFCHRRKWLTLPEFNELYAVCKLLPGPVSTQMAISIGRQQAGLKGGVLAGVAFILPAFVMILGLAVFYVRFAGLKVLAPVFTGMQAGAMVVILFSTWRLSSPFAKNPRAWVLALVSGVLTFVFPRYEPLVIIGLGLTGAWRFAGGQDSFDRPRKSESNFFAISMVTGGGAVGVLKHTVLGQLFWVSFKAGAFMFGTGLAIVPLLEADVVQHYGWLTHGEFMDALAMGQVTPGPIVIAATFVGFKAAGLAGALVATGGMFLPAFFNVLFLVPMIWNRFKGTKGAEGFTAWAVPAVVGGILAAAIQLGATTLMGVVPLLIFSGFFLTSLRWSIPVWLLIPTSGLIGFVVNLRF